jgi:hypothetical protein
VMSLHGEFARAWRMAPAGPVAVVGMIAFALAMLALAWVQRVPRGAPRVVDAAKWEAAGRAWIRKGVAVYAVGALMVWLGGWAISLQSALSAR